MVQGPPARDNPLLTGIRGVAAAWVAVFHFYPWLAAIFECPVRGRVWFVRDGFLGVDLFFLLSGFVLMMSYGPRLSAGSLSEIFRFLVARAFRILPMHWTVLVILAALVGIVPAYARQPYVFTSKAFVESAALVQGLLPDAALAWNRPSWSISDECVAYLLFPALAPLIWTFRSFRACWLAVALALLSLGFVVMHGLHSDTLNVVQAGGLLRCVCEFTAGAFACRAWQLNGPMLRRLADPLALAGLLMLALAVRYSARLDVLAPFGLLALVVASGAGGRVAAFLFGSAAAVFLGEISYSLYLVHIGLFDLLAVPGVMRSVLTMTAWQQIVVVVFTWATLLLLSWLGYRHVEQPFRSYGRTLTRHAIPSHREG